MKRYLGLVLAFIIVVSVCSCSKEEYIDNPNPSKPLKNADEAIMSYEGESISTGLYSFIFSYQKTNMLYSYQNLGVSDAVEDTEAFWNSETENGKLGELTVKDINDHCRMILLCNKMASEYGVKLGETELEYVEEEINDLTAAYGSTAGLDEYLKRYGVTAEDVENYFSDKYLILSLRNTLCAEGGICEVSKTDVNKEIERAYGKTTHIYLTDAKYEGNAKAKAEEILAALKNGADMKDYANLSEDTTYKTYPDGTLISYGVDNAYTETAEELKVGEYSICTFGEGVYIIKKFALTDKDKDSLYDSAFTSLADEKFMSLMEERYSLVEIEKTELDKFDIVTAETIAF